jgi:hypothetical protein
MLDWTEAGLWIVLLVVGSLVALAVLRDSETRNRPRADAKPAPGGLIEAEDLPVIAKSREFSFWLQPASGFRGGNWSKDGHMFAHGTVNGDWIEFRLPVPEPGRYALELFLTKAADYGIVAVSVNGARLGTFDLWSGRGVVPTGALKLGDVELGGSEDVLRVAIEGNNPNASPSFFQFGIDGIRIGEPAPLTSGESKRGAISKAPEAEPIRSEPDANRVPTEGG